MTTLSRLALGLGLLVAATPAAWASSEAPFAGESRPLHSVVISGGHGDTSPQFGAIAGRVGGYTEELRVIATGQSHDVAPLALVGSDPSVPAAAPPAYASFPLRRG